MRKQSLIFEEYYLEKQYVLRNIVLSNNLLMSVKRVFKIQIEQDKTNVEYLNFHNKLIEKGNKIAFVPAALPVT